MTRILKLFLLTTLVLALAGACGGRAPTTGKTEQNENSPGSSTKAPPVAQKTLPASPTEAADLAPVEAPTEEADDSQGSSADTLEDDLSLSNRDAGLEDLKSYKASWQLNWKSVEGDRAEEIAWKWLQEHIADPQASHSRWESTKSGEESGSMEVWQIGQDTYYVTRDAEGKSNCTVSSSDEPNKVDSSVMSPRSLGSISDAKFAGNETLNGIKTRHYTYNETSLTLGGGGKLTGEVWVAVEGGYVVKDQASWEGAMFGLGGNDTAKGAGSWVWEITEVNGPFEIKAPSGCESAATGLPAMPDATERFTLGDAFTYKTATKLADVVKFYQDEMPKAGWEAEGDPVIAKEMASLTFKKDGQTANVMLTADGDNVNVFINVQKE